MREWPSAPRSDRVPGEDVLDDLDTLPERRARQRLLHQLEVAPRVARRRAQPLGLGEPVLDGLELLLLLLAPLVNLAHREPSGQIVVAPSLHRSGRPYRWMNRMELAALPEWLNELLADQPRDVEAPPPMTRPHPNRLRRYGEAALARGSSGRRRQERHAQRHPFLPARLARRDGRQRRARGAPRLARLASAARRQDSAPSRPG
jgi:hypothetical protein